MKLNHTDEINYTKSCIKLLVMTWICIGVILLADTLTIFIDAKYLSTTIFFTGFRSYVLIPGILNIASMAIVHVLSYFLLKKKNYKSQACLYIVGITFICYILARCNSEVNINIIFFIIPIVLSMFYLEKKLLTFSLVTSMIAFTAYTFQVRSEIGMDMTHAMQPIDIEITLVLTAIVFVMGLMIIERAESLHKAAEEANTRRNQDMLTGYLNHSGFYNDLDETFKNADKKGDFALALIDIDNFTLINEEYGRGFGDEVIETMVSSINKSLVNSSKAYRYGGEEFVIMCNGSQDIVINMVDSILRDFRNKTEMKLDVAITASAGICEYDPKKFRGKRDIFAAMDEALYAAKRLGKNQYGVWDETIVRDSFAANIKEEDIEHVM